MNPTPNTARITWIAHCLWRLKRQYASGTLLVSGQPLSWAQYVRLVQYVLNEYREDENGPAV